MIVSKQKIFLRALVIMAFLGLILAACSPKDQLLGVWKQRDGDLHIRFLTGDRISQRAYFGDNVLTLTGTYQIINDHQINIDFQDGDWRGLKGDLYDFSISGDELHLDGMIFDRQPDVYSLE